MVLVEECHRIQVRGLLDVYNRPGNLCDFDWAQHGFSVLLCCDGAYVCDGIVCIVSENAIDFHRMHIPLYGVCIEKRKRRLPSLRIFGRAARVLAYISWEAGRGLGVIRNTFCTCCEHRKVDKDFDVVC
jgi:hypothetical protein